MDDGFTTRAIRAATRVPRVDQPPSSVPIYQAATFASADADELAEVTGGRTPGYVYAWRSIRIARVGIPRRTRNALNGASVPPVST